MPGEKIAFTKEEFEKVVHDPNAVAPLKWTAILRCGCRIEKSEDGIINLTRVGNRCPANELGHAITNVKGKKTK